MSTDDRNHAAPLDADKGRGAKARVAAALRKMDRLHELSAAAAGAEDLDRLPEMALDVAVEELGADFGHVQLYDPESETLRIVAQRGFDQTFLDYFARVVAGPPRSGVCREGFAVTR